MLVETKETCFKDYVYLQPSVLSQVYAVVALLRESSAAVLASEWCLPSVDQHVNP